MLVLSGGGARGTAHIGVLKALEAQRIPIAAIVGHEHGCGGRRPVRGRLRTGEPSIGSFAASIGRTSSSTTPIVRVFRFRRKREDSEYLARAAAGYHLDGIKLPSGAVYGQKVMAALKRHTLHTIDVDAFRRPCHSVSCGRDGHRHGATRRDRSTVSSPKRCMRAWRSPR